MQLHVSTPDQGGGITGYGDGFIRWGHQVVRHAVLVHGRSCQPFAVAHWQALSPDGWRPVLALNPEIVLLGTGRRQHFPPPAVLAPLHAHGVGVEVMDTAAACRSLAVLMAEARQVAAVLLMIEPEATTSDNPGR